MRLALGLLALSGLLGCTSGAGQAEREPTGTPTDPVDVCRRAGDVCRMGGSRLGVCNPVPAETRPAACAADAKGPAPEAGCFVCMSQH
jgi:hypothetical protein